MAGSVGREENVWQPRRRSWGWADGLALLVWTAALAALFFDVVSLRRALFYFDVTEINFPYRHFFASELKAGRFSLWCPGLYCGHPLYSESQTGYLHPLKYFLYPWLPTWQAFNLDTVLSIWLTGVGSYGWLRRHVGSAGALTGASVFGLSGFVWAHLIHTSMNNALTSVPFVFWGLEVSWAKGRLRGLVAGAFALACQVFAGHLQDTILTAGAVGLYGVYRAATERHSRDRLSSIGMTVGMLVLGIALAAVQWIPSKELLDRSPRAGGLSWEQLTYGSWHPELIPTLVVREAYGTRARGTDWLDGPYPYHEMDTYMGLIAMSLAVVGAAAYRDRWVGFWVLLAGVGGVLMLGRHTVLFDYAHRIPVVGSSRIPVRLHLWTSLALAALASVGVDRLARPGTVRLRPALALAAALVVVSAAILAVAYSPAWAGSGRALAAYRASRDRALEHELLLASGRTFVLGMLALGAAGAARRATRPRLRTALASTLPLLVLADLLGAHWFDVPTIDPSYWLIPPPTVRALKTDPSLIRISSLTRRSMNMPGFASAPLPFFAVRDTLEWSLPIVWGLKSSTGQTPIVPRRGVEYAEHVRPGRGRFAVESVSHVVASEPELPVLGKGTACGAAYLYRVPDVRPRARLMGRPFYVTSESAAVRALDRLGAGLLDRVVVEDPDRPLSEAARPTGTASIRAEVPERLEVQTQADGDAYLVLTDTFDPGWSATLDGRPVPIRPAFVAFRAVFVPKGAHTVVFRYEPAGFRAGLAVTGIALVLALVALAWPWPVARLDDEHADAGWPRGWPWWGLAALVAVLGLSIVRIGPSGTLQLQDRWRQSFHRLP